MTGWWRRNRIGLALVPVALVGALAGNASRLNDYWWAIDLHAHQSAGADGVVHFRDHFDDGHVRYPIEADISLVSVKRATGVTIDGASHPVSIPDDSQLWEVTTHWVADRPLPSTCARSASRAPTGATGSARNPTPSRSTTR